jgi:WS/DGAT/MGAT family acyltransferase
MSTRDAGFLYLERPHARLQIGCLALIEGRIGRADLARRIEACLPRVRRYAQRALHVPLSLAHPIWTDDPAFRALDHVHRRALPAPGGEAELLEAAAEVLALPLDADRPLWAMHIVEGLDGGRSAVVQVVHHCMVDGVSGAQLLELLLDPDRVPCPAPPPRPPAAELAGAARRVRRALAENAWTRARQAARVARAIARPGSARQALEDLRSAAWSALQLATGDLPRLPWNARIGPRRRLSLTRLPIAGVRRIRAAHGGTLNDVVLCCLAGGIRRYLEGNGVDVRRLEVAALVPVSLRSPDEAEELGNRISAMLVPLCIDRPEEAARLAATRAATERLKSGPAWVGLDALLRLLDALPAPLVALGGRHLDLFRVANLVATNVPGPREPRFLCGAPVEALYPVVPITDGLGLSIAVLSYAGWLHVGLNADADALPDLEKLTSGIDAAFSSLLAGATPDHPGSPGAPRMVLT